MKNNKGFAVAGILYILLLLFLIMITSLLALYANRKQLLDRLKETAKNQEFVQDNKNYVEVDYIESDGSSYINTGFLPNSNTKVVMKAETLDTSQNALGWFGSRQDTSINSYAVWQNLGKLRTDFSTDLKDTGIGLHLGEQYSIEKDGSSFNVNSVSFSNISAGAVGFISPLPLTIFGVNTAVASNQNDAESVDKRMAKLKLYSFQVYDGETMVRNYIPVLSLEDGHLGEAALYDKVSKTIYYKKGEGNLNINNNQWEKIPTLLGENSKIYADFSDFLSTYPELSKLDNKDVLDYLKNSPTLISKLKKSSNYASTIVPILLNSDNLINEEKYALGLPCYIYNNGLKIGDSWGEYKAGLGSYTDTSTSISASLKSDSPYAYSTVTTGKINLEKYSKLNFNANISINTNGFYALVGFSTGDNGYSALNGGPTTTITNIASKDFTLDISSINDQRYFGITVVTPGNSNQITGTINKAYIY